MLAWGREHARALECLAALPLPFDAQQFASALEDAGSACVFALARFLVLGRWVEYMPAQTAERDLFCTVGDATRRARARADGLAHEDAERFAERWRPETQDAIGGSDLGIMESEQ